MKLSVKKLKILDKALFQNIRKIPHPEMTDLYIAIWKDIFQNDFKITQRTANILEDENFHSLTSVLIKLGYLDEHGKVIPKTPPSEATVVVDFSPQGSETGGKLEEEYGK